MAKTAVAARKTTAVSTDSINRLAQMAQEAKATEESVSLGNWVTMRAGIMKYQGNPIKGNTMPVIILDHLMENAYFPGKFDPDTPTSPICYAFGSKDADLAPHPSAEQPQSEKCSTCKWNAFGTADTGKGKACKNTRRLGMIHADALKNPDSVATSPIAMAKLPVTSVKGWAGYVQQLANVKNTHPMGVVTRLSCMPDEERQVRVEFELLEDITNGVVIDALLARRADVTAQLNKPYQANSPAKPAAKASAKGKRRF